MENLLRMNSKRIIHDALETVLPDAAVIRALQNHEFSSGRIRLLAVGKAAWQMAKAANDVLGKRIETGLVLTKYGHGKGPIANYKIMEAGHPVPDENTIRGTEQAVELTCGLTAEDTVLFLLSGGGSALFELPIIPLGELKALTESLLSSGADINEINTVRKRVSSVKGGRFALHCAPAKVFSIILSDVLGDEVSQIASGPTVLDTSTQEEALAILKKYHLDSGRVLSCVSSADTPRSLDNAESVVIGSVRQLCAAAADTCTKLGYKTYILTDRLTCEAREAGAFLAAVAQSHWDTKIPLAFIAGGETVVHVTGNGLGGRNQELALAAASGLDGLAGCALFSIGSDGTDGPTDAAGGYVDGNTAAALRENGLNIYEVLRRNDAYHALDKIGGLIKTGSTGTNVNDVTVLLINSLGR